VINPTGQSSIPDGRDCTGNISVFGAPVALLARFEDMGYNRKRCPMLNPLG